MTDKECLLNNWQFLLENYDKLCRNTDFANFIVKDFTLSTSVCCCMGSVIVRCYLKDLLNAWKNGYMYASKPIITTYLKSSGPIYITVIDGSNLLEIKDKWKKYPIDFEPEDLPNKYNLDEIVEKLKQDS